MLKKRGRDLVRGLLSPRTLKGVIPVQKDRLKSWESYYFTEPGQHPDNVPLKEGKNLFLKESLEDTRKSPSLSAI